MLSDASKHACKPSLWSYVFRWPVWTPIDKNSRITQAIDSSVLLGTTFEFMEKIRTSIWVISLPESTERRTQFERAATSRGIPWSFFDACRTVVQDLRYDPDLARKHFGRELRLGEIGCYSSHFALWQKLLSDDSADQYLIMEDDIIVDWEAVQRIIATDLGESGTDFVRLFYKFPSKHRVVRRSYTGPNVFLLQLFGPAWGTQAYIINKNAAQKFVDSLDIIKRPIDVAMDRYWESGVKNLSIFPFPVLERSISSTIESGRGNDGRLTLSLTISKLLDRLIRAFWYYAAAPASLVDGLNRLRKKVARASGG